MLPELVDTGTIHIDAFLGALRRDQKGPISPYLGYSKAREAETMRKIYRYWRDRGIDVTSEWAFGLRDDRFVGLQPWCWHQEDNVADLPNELYCSTKWVGCDMWFIEDLMNPPHVREKFYLEILPWYYKNNPAGIGEIANMIDGSDICMPALWCAEKTLIAYSQTGYKSRTWELPPDWQGVKTVAVARQTGGGEPYITAHVWIEIRDSGDTDESGGAAFRAGFYPIGGSDMWGVPGWVKNNDPASSGLKKCHEIKINPCRYNVEQFKFRVKSKSLLDAGQCTGTYATNMCPYNYWLLGYNCKNWAGDLIEYAMKKSRGCSMPQ